MNKQQQIIEIAKILYEMHTDTTIDCEYIAEILINDKDYRKQARGRWIGKPLCGNDSCRCSACGAWWNIHVNLSGEAMQKYCPSCGAKME